MISGLGDFGILVRKIPKSPNLKINNLQKEFFPYSSPNSPPEAGKKGALNEYHNPDEDVGE